MSEYFEWLTGVGPKQKLTFCHNCDEMTNNLKDGPLIRCEKCMMGKGVIDSEDKPIR